MIFIVSVFGFTKRQTSQSSCKPNIVGIVDLWQKETTMYK